MLQSAQSSTGGPGRPPLHGERWLPEDDAVLGRLHAEGELPAVIAEALERTVVAVESRIRWLQAAGRLPARKPRWTPARQRRLVRRRQAGVSLRKLEAEFGVTRGTINAQIARLRRLGFPVDP